MKGIWLNTARKTSHRSRHLHSSFKKNQSRFATQYWRGEWWRSCCKQAQSQVCFWSCSFHSIYHGNLDLYFHQHSFQVFPWSFKSRKTCANSPLFHKWKSCPFTFNSPAIWRSFECKSSLFLKSQRQHWLFCCVFEPFHHLHNLSIVLPASDWCNSLWSLQSLFCVIVGSQRWTMEASNGVC